MKRVIKILIGISLWALISCEDSINPKEEFEEEYVLNCIIRSNSEFQKLSLLKTFNVEGFNPKDNNANPFVKGTTISLSYRGDTFYFQDSSIAPENSQRFDGPLEYYYLDNFQPDRNQTEIKVNAQLPNGEILEAVAETPISFSIRLDDSNRNIPPEDNSSYINIFWQPYNTSYFQYYQVSLRIHFEEIKNGEAKKDFVEVPIEVEQENGKQDLVYPSPRRHTSISYPVRMVDLAMQKIAEKVESTDSVYVNREATFQALALDANLAAYYFAGLSENIYTVRIDEILYSNVEGGYGIFGVVWEEEFNIQVQQSYIQSFGYNVFDDG